MMVRQAHQQKSIKTKTTEYNRSMQKGVGLSSTTERSRSMPKEWEIKMLVEVCEFQNGKAHEKIIDENGKYILVNSKFISSDGKRYKRTNQQLKPLVKGDIVFVMSDVPNGKALAKCFLVDKDNLYTLNQRICVIKTNNYDKNFLFYHLNRHKYLLSFNNGENQTNLRKNDILKCPLVYPPLPEQKRIVSILDRVFEAIDKAKANAEQNLKNAKELFESYLNRIFEEKGDDWEEKRLGKVCVKTETVNPKLEPNKDFIYIDVSSVNKESKMIEETTILLGKDAPSRARKLVKTNDVIFATVRPTHQRVTLITNEYNNQVCSTGYYVLRPRRILNSRVIYYFLLTYHFNEEMVKLQKGASYPAVTNKDVESQIIPFPKSIEKQKQIVQQLDKLQTETKKMEAIYQKKIENLEEFKKSVLQKAFEGEL